MHSVLLKRALGSWEFLPRLLHTGQFNVAILFYPSVPLSQASSTLQGCSV